MGISLCYKHMMVLAGRPLRSSKQRHRKHGPVQELPQLNALSKVCQAREQLDDSCRSTTGPQQRLKSTEKLGSELWPFTLRDTRELFTPSSHFWKIKRQLSTVWSGEASAVCFTDKFRAVSEGNSHCYQWAHTFPVFTCGVHCRAYGTRVLKSLDRTVSTVQRGSRFSLSSTVCLLHVFHWWAYPSPGYWSRQGLMGSEVCVFTCALFTSPVRKVLQQTSPVTVKFLTHSHLRRTNTLT